MKVRMGFVSNSSSMSFIARLDSYDSVFDLARRMLDIWIHEHFDEYDSREVNERDFEWIEHIQVLIDKLYELEDFGVDPNTPVRIPSINFDSWIVKKPSGYYCNTSNNHFQWEQLEGIIRRIHESDEEGHFYLPSEHFFYDVTRDIMLKRLPWKEYKPDEMRCLHDRENNRPYTIEKFMLITGEIVCPKCDKEKVDAARVIQNTVA